MYIIFKELPSGCVPANYDHRYCGELFGIAESVTEAIRIVFKLNNNPYGHKYSWVHLSVSNTLYQLGELKE